MYPHLHDPKGSFPAPPFSLRADPRPITPRSTKLFFFNNWHNGDLIFCRPLLDLVIASERFEVALGGFCNTAYLWEDLVGPHVSLLVSDWRDEDGEPRDLSYLCPDEFIPVDLWLGQYLDTQAHSWESTVRLFNRKMLEHEIDFAISFDPQFTPMVRFSSKQGSPLPVSSLERQAAGLIYVENGPTRSGHSQFGFDIARMSRDLGGYLIFCTSNPGLNAPNVVDCSGLSLIELSLLSDRCQLILGKGSGPFLCTYTEINRKKPRAVCGYDLSRWAPFWPYEGNPLVHLDTMDQVMRFIRGHSK